jgi:hypothetical protein
MGLFSWLLNDTGDNIPHGANGREHIPVVMLDNKGNKWYEYSYSGNGMFGGKDFYELVAEMNGITEVPEDAPKGMELRDIGIKLAFSKEVLSIQPNLINEDNADHWVWENEAPKDCPNQGY